MRPCVSRLERGRALNLHDLLMILAETKFGLREKPIDDIIAAAHTVIDKVMISVWARDKQRRRIALRESWRPCPGPIPKTQRDSR
jgi:hypothetical protein